MVMLATPGFESNISSLDSGHPPWRGCPMSSGSQAFLMNETPSTRRPALTGNRTSSESCAWSAYLSHSGLP